MQQDVENSGDQRRGHGSRPSVRDVGLDADVRHVRQSYGQTPGSDSQGVNVPTLARGQRQTACMAASAQLRLVNGRGATNRVDGRPTERGHRAVLCRADSCGARRCPSSQPAATDRLGSGHGRVRRLVRARIQRAVLRRFCGGRARAVHTQRRLLSAGRLFGRSSH